MKVRLTYKELPISDFDSLLEKNFDLASPERSTVPLLAYWSDYEHRANEMAEVFPALVRGDEVTVGFEHRVRPPKGKGTSSHTDVMIHSEGNLAFEAKYMEPLYENVRTWLRLPPSANRVDVLQGWTDLINQSTGCRMDLESIMDCTYQLVHRTASACHRSASMCGVAYHLFDSQPDKVESYAKEIRKLTQRLSERENLTFQILITEMQPTDQYRSLRRQWKQAGKPDMSNQVRTLLKDRKIATFGKPLVISL